MIRRISLFILTLFVSSAVSAENVPDPVIIPLQFDNGECSVAWDFFFPSEELSAICFSIDTEGPKPFFVINYIDDKKEFYYSLFTDTIVIKDDFESAVSALFGALISPDEIPNDEFVFRYGDKKLSFNYNNKKYSFFIEIDEDGFFGGSKAVYRNPKSFDGLKQQLSGASINDTFKQLINLITYAKTIGIEVKKDKTLLEKIEEIEEDLYYYY